MCVSLRLVEITRKTLRFLITSIHVVEDKICVTCLNDSITLYTYNEDEQKLDFWKRYYFGSQYVVFMLIY